MENRMCMTRGDTRIMSLLISAPALRTEDNSIKFDADKPLLDILSSGVSMLNKTTPFEEIISVEVSIDKKNTATKLLKHRTLEILI